MIPLPSPRRVIELMIIGGIILWIVQDPHGAGTTAGGLIHGIVHVLQQIPVFVSDTLHSSK